MRARAHAESFPLHSPITNPHVPDVEKNAIHLLIKDHAGVKGARGCATFPINLMFKLGKLNTIGA